MMPVPYKSTPVFDESTLPDAIRSAHNTKAGVWGLLVMLEGEVDLVFHDPRRIVRATPAQPAPIAPQAVHHVETDGPMQMKVEFYREHPLGASA
ncbi:MAG: DUF1971 domain-containing protein [Caenibius sp.]